MSYMVEPAVDDEEGVVADVAREGHPPAAPRHRVALVAVDHKEQTAVDRAVYRLPRDHDVAELQIAETPQILVVVAGHQSYRRPCPSLREHGANDVAVEMRPVRRALEPPEIDDVTDEIQVIAVVRVEELEQVARPTVSCP